MIEENRLTVALLLLHLKMAKISGVSLAGTQLTAPLKLANLSPTVAKDLAENTLAKLLKGETAFSPLVASLRVALLLGARVNDAVVADEQTVKKAKDLVIKTLNHWTNKKSKVCILLINYSVVW